MERCVDTYGTFGKGLIPYTYLTLGCNLYSRMGSQQLQNPINIRSNIRYIDKETNHTIVLDNP